jgi:hypothetical protein
VNVLSSWRRRDDVAPESSCPDPDVVDNTSIPPSGAPQPASECQTRPPVTSVTDTSRLPVHTDTVNDPALTADTNSRGMRTCRPYLDDQPTNQPIRGSGSPSASACAGWLTLALRNRQRNAVVNLNRRRAGGCTFVGLTVAMSS